MQSVSNANIFWNTKICEYCCLVCEHLEVFQYSNSNAFHFFIFRRDHVENILTEREGHFEKLVSFDNQSHGALTEEDIRSKRDAVEDTEDLVASLNERLEAAMEKNTKLV